jgi:hypothetical protein
LAFTCMVNFLLCIFNSKNIWPELAHHHVAGSSTVRISFQSSCIYLYGLWEGWSVSSKTLGSLEGLENRTLSVQLDHWESLKWMITSGQGTRHLDVPDTWN